ncbi:MAG TPA: WD40 repeat domain-containing serine/threonine protein kinase [Pirellulales bacterium]|jgi:WD40 repeat protein
MVWLASFAPDASTTDLTEPSSHLAFPRLVGRYRLDALLGRGAYGAVFAAADLERGIDVAVKIAWPAVMFSAAASRRFVEEPTIAAELAHPGIIKIYDYGWLDAVCFIALELIEGPTLEQWAASETPPTITETVLVMEKVAKAVHFAHQQGIVHRDLKPSNVLLRPSPGSTSAFEPVVSDFGLARRPDDPAFSIATLTGVAVGTDFYMSPEQARGDSNVEAASDVFSLGVILYELLARRRPFGGRTSDDIRRGVREDEPQPIRTLNKQVTKNLETIVLKCLEKLPHHRYATAGALGDDLRRFFNDEPIHIRRPSLARRGIRLARRRPATTLVLAGAVFGMLLFVFAIAFWREDRVATGKHIAAAEEATKMAEKAEREHQYASTIRSAALAVQRGLKGEAVELLKESRFRSPGRIANGFEWQWLWKKANSAERSFVAHPGGVFAVGFSPRGDILASSGEDDYVALWDTRDWSKQASWHSPMGIDVNALAFSADGSMLAMGRDDGSLVVRSVPDQTVIFDEAVIGGRIWCLSWLGSEGKLAAGGDGSKIVIIDPKTRARDEILLTRDRKLEHAIGPIDGIRGLSYLASGEVLIADHQGIQDLQFVYPKTQTPPRSWMFGGGVYVACPIPGAVPRLLLSTQSKASPALTHSISVCQIEGPPPEEFCTLHGNSSFICCSSNGESAAIAFVDGTIQILNIEDVEKGKPAVASPRLAHAGRVVTAAFSPDSSRLISAGADGNLSVWSTANVVAGFDISLAGRPWGVRFSPSGEQLMIVERTQNDSAIARMYDVESKVPQWEARVVPYCTWRMDYWGYRCRFSPDGEDVVVLESGGQLQIRSAHTGAIVQRFDPGRSTVCENVAYSLDGKCIYVLLQNYYSENGSPRRSRDLDYTHVVLDRASNRAIESSNSKNFQRLGQIHTGRGDLWFDMFGSRECRLRRATDEVPSVILRGPNERLYAVDVSRDGWIVAATGAEGIIYCWDLRRPSSYKKMVGHAGPVVDIRFARDDQTLITRGTDDTVRFWHVPTSSELLTLGGPEEKMLNMDLSSDGTLLALGIESKGRYGIEIHRLLTPEGNSTLDATPQSLPGRF